MSAAKRARVPPHSMELKHKRKRKKKKKGEKVNKLQGHSLQECQNCSDSKEAIQSVDVGQEHIFIDAITEAESLKPSDGIRPFIKAIAGSKASALTQEATRRAKHAPLLLGGSAKAVKKQILRKKCKQMQLFVEGERPASSASEITNQQSNSALPMLASCQGVSPSSDYVAAKECAHKGKSKPAKADQVLIVTTKWKKHKTRQQRKQSQKNNGSQESPKDVGLNSPKVSGSLLSSHKEHSNSPVMSRKDMLRQKVCCFRRVLT